MTEIKRAVPGSSKVHSPKSYGDREAICNEGAVSEVSASGGVRVLMHSALDFDVVVLNHMNIPTILLGNPPRADRRIDPNETVKPRKLTVEIQVNYKNQMGIEQAADIMDILSSTMVKSSNAYKTIRRNMKMLRDRWDNPNIPKTRFCNRSRQLNSSYRLSPEDIRGKPGGLYDEISGLLFVDLEIYTREQVPVHPLSEFAREISERKNATVHIADIHSTVLDITFVDNSDRFGKLFGFAFGTVTELVSVKDPTRQDGVYVRRRMAFQTESESTTEYLPIDEAMETMQLYATRHEAQTNGRPEKILERQERELQEKINSRKREIDLQKNELDAARIELDKQRAELEGRVLETDRLKAELNAKLEEKSFTVKDKTLDYEQRSAQQKVESETRKAHYEARKENADVISGALKLCGIIVGAVVSVLGLIKVFF